MSGKHDFLLMLARSGYPRSGMHQGIDTFRSKPDSLCEG